MRRVETGTWFVMPAILLLAAVTIFPIMDVVYPPAFTGSFSSLAYPEFTGLQNYRFLLQDERFWRARSNTIYFTGLSVVLEVVLGLALALLMNRAFRGKGLVRAVLVPWAIPTVVSAKMWEWIYNGDFRVLNYLLGTKVNWLGDPFWALHAAIIMDVWKTTPFAA